MSGLVELSVHDATEVALAVKGMALVGHTMFNPLDGITAASRITDPAKLYVLVRETIIDAPRTPTFTLPEPVEIVKAPT